MAKVHIESIYGFYHGQDPRVFEPDMECCTKQEIDNWKKGVELANLGQWKSDGSGCFVENSAIVCKSSMGIGVYSYIITDDGDFVRDATWEDTQRESQTWDEDVIIDSD